MSSLESPESIPRNATKLSIQQLLANDSQLKSNQPTQNEDSNVIHECWKNHLKVRADFAQNHSLEFLFSLCDEEKGKQNDDFSFRTFSSSLACLFLFPLKRG
jgi:hypothetical protein